MRGDYARRFSLDLMSKDMRLSANSRDGWTFRSRRCEAARASFERAIAAGYGGDDFSRAIEFHARTADTTI